MLLIEPHFASAAAARRFCALNFDSNRLLSHTAPSFISRNNKLRRGGNGIRAAAAKEQSSSDSTPVKPIVRYHPFEEIAGPDLLTCGDATLTPAETTRTIIEVNSKATLMFTGIVNEEIHENIFWPDLSYVTDEHGNIYFQVKNDEDILQTLITEDTIVGFRENICKLKFCLDMNRLNGWRIRLSAHYTISDKSNVEIEDFRKAEPDAIAHSAAKVISRLKAGGEKTTQALKSLCWRCKGIQVEDCLLIGVDSLGFDLRVCSGTQVQTLRFSFKKRASSEYSAERQLNDLLFPRAQKFQQKKEAQQAKS